MVIVVNLTAITTALASISATAIFATHVEIEVEIKVEIQVVVWKISYKKKIYFNIRARWSNF